jgi:hypothetical protein
MPVHYLDVLTLRVRTFDGHPSLGTLTGENILEVTVGDRVDVDAVAAEITGDLQDWPRRIQQSVTETNWGASGSGAELIVDIPTVLSSIASLPIIWEMISQRILRLGHPRRLDAQAQAESARAWLAQSLNLGPHSIAIVGPELIAVGGRIELHAASKGRFILEMDDQGVSRMRRS